MAVNFPCTRGAVLLLESYMDISRLQTKGIKSLDKGHSVIVLKYSSRLELTGTFLGMDLHVSYFCCGMVPFHFDNFLLSSVQNSLHSMV
jgi:hypothetical protein